MTATPTADALVPALYDELRAIAHRHLARRRGAAAGSGTLVTASLVNEAYLKLADRSNGGWRDRTHFLAVASVAMRHILADHARARVAAKRGGGAVDTTLDTTLEEALAADGADERLLDLDEALDRLAALSPRLARVVECKFFGGLSEEETAEALGITARTVQRDWAKARALLRRALAD